MGDSDLEDPEVLLLQVRSDVTAHRFREALLCYHAGAYAACISEIWQAVLTDALEKAKVLSRHGHEHASQLLVEFDRIVQLRKSDEQESVKVSSRYEKNLLVVLCSQLGIISGYEKMDLERIREDRNRCGHLSYHERSIPFLPTAELARLHLRNAAESLLNKPARRGEATAAQLLSWMNGEEFPASAAAARLQVTAGELLDIDDSALQIVVDELLKITIESDPESGHFVKALAALSALEANSGNRISMIFRHSVSSLQGSLGQVDENVLIRVYSQVPSTWKAIPTELRQSFGSFIQSMPLDTNQGVLNWAAAMEMSEMRQIAESRIEEIDDSTLAQVSSQIGYDLYLSTVLERLRTAPNFDAARKLIRYLGYHFVPYRAWSHTAMLSLKTAIQENDQVSEVSNLTVLLQRLNENVHRSYWYPVCEWLEVLQPIETNSNDIGSLIQSLEQTAM